MCGVFSGDFAGDQIIGSRSRQEDSYAFVPADEKCAHKGCLAILSDGMGGHNAGDAASNIIVETFASAFLYGGADLPALLQKSLSESNAKVAELSKKAGDCGATLVAAYVENDRLNWISVGDSPLLLCRGGKITRLNQDHSMRGEVERLLAAGEISAGQAASMRNCLLSAVCGDEIELVDQPREPFELKQGDFLILASDGIETLSFGEIASIISEKSFASVWAILQSLLNAVVNKAKPMQDNTTIMLIKI